MLKNKIVKNLFIALNMCFAGFGFIYAAPALPSLLEITQPNGAKFKAYLRGDEYFSWWESEKGTVLFRHLESGYFEYAKISIIDDKEKKTLVSASSIEKEIKDKKAKKMEKSNLIGEILAKRAKEKNINEVYFDRGENKYHGRVKIFADTLRKNGMEF